MVIQTNMNITVFTPTYNRAKTLSRVYESLLNQTNKDFVWLIIDDGSTDNTKELVAKWIEENKLSIEYHYKENGGKHTAMKMAYELTQTKYLLAIDSDDELTADAVNVFLNEWKEIEKDGFESQFAEISGLTFSNDGNLIGNFTFPAGINQIDSNWHEMVLRFQNNNEHVVCWNTEKLRECVQIPVDFWLSDKVNFFGEGTLWARIGRKYKTRYINNKLRIYHYDGGDSLMRIHDKTQGHYNNLVGNMYFLDENLDYFFWNPKYFIHLILKFVISGIELKFSSFTLLKQMNTSRFRLYYSLHYPIGLGLWFYYKKIRKQFWF